MKIKHAIEFNGGRDSNKITELEICVEADPVTGSVDEILNVYVIAAAGSLRHKIDITDIVNCLFANDLDKYIDSLDFKEIIDLQKW